MLNAFSPENPPGAQRDRFLALGLIVGEGSPARTREGVPGHGIKDGIAS
jgi:hypothetical protein